MVRSTPEHNAVGPNDGANGSEKKIARENLHFY